MVAQKKEVDCIDCGALFVSRNVRTLRCDNCKASHKKQPKVYRRSCAHCSEQFETVNQYTVTCSLTCSASARASGKMAAAKKAVMDGIAARKMKREARAKNRQRRSYEMWMTTQKLVSLMRDAWGDKYDYSTVEYTGFDNHVTVVCPDHGPATHRYDYFRKSNSPCRECKGFGKRLTHEQYIEKCRKRHGDRYDYVTEYQFGDKGWIEFICPDHGLQRMTCKGHLRSSEGCPACTIEKMDFNKNPFGGINAKTCARNPDEPISLYIMELEAGGGRYYKVGLSRNLRRRLMDVARHHDSATILHSRKGRILDMYRIEQALIARCGRTEAASKFGGHTECVKANPMDHLKGVEDELAQSF